jgi:hypothetical protein
MSGGVSHIDTFDPKPALEKYVGQPLAGKGEVVVRQGHPGPLMPSPFKFRKYGQSGMDVSELFPAIAQPRRRSRFSTLGLSKLNEMDLESYPGSSAFRMQGCAPEAVDVNRESEATRKLYGMDDKTTEPFGRQCLMARRLVERGVRFVQLYHGGLGVQNLDTWDAHNDVKENHTRHAAEVDRPIAGLLTDLKVRGLLDSTLVTWHGEFGRMPISQKGVGRDHNPGAMTVWMAGARIKGGQAIGTSDEFGYKAEQQPIAVHDLHATMLHLLGMDHTKLTYLFNGRNMRLTDVYGELIPQIVS